MTTDLPQELVDIILENVGDDKATLAQCSLVCHSWSPRSRRLLFAKIHIIISRTRSNSPAPVRSQLHSFLSYLNHSPRPAVAGHIHDVRIKGQSPTSRRRSPARLDLVDLLQLLQLLSNLSSLTLDNLVLTYDQRFERGVLASPPTHTLKELYLHEIAGYVPEGQHPLLELFGIFTKIHSLTVMTFSKESINTECLSPLTRRVHISRVLGIRMRDYDILSCLLDKVADIQDFCHCGITLYYPSNFSMDDMGSAHPLLELVNKGQLRILELDMRMFKSWDQADDTAWAKLNIFGVHPIPSLIIHAYTRVNLPNYQRDLWCSLLALFSKMSLETIDVHLYIGGALNEHYQQDNAITIDWSSLDPIVATLTNFQNFTLHIAFTGWQEVILCRDLVESSDDWIKLERVFKVIAQNVEKKLKGLCEKKLLNVIWQQSVSPTLANV